MTENGENISGNNGEQKEHQIITVGGVKYDSITMMPIVTKPWPTKETLDAIAEKEPVRGGIRHPCADGAGHWTSVPGGRGRRSWVPIRIKSTEEEHQKVMEEALRLDAEFQEGLDHYVLSNTIRIAKPTD